jgi:hypothetical protein
MSDDPKKKARDRDRINTSYEVRYWSKKFGVSPKELKFVKSMRMLPDGVISVHGSG